LSHADDFCDRRCCAHDDRARDFCDRRCCAHDDRARDFGLG
jgi:hypothetical protein